MKKNYLLFFLVVFLGIRSEGRSFTPADSSFIFSVKTPDKETLKFVKSYMTGLSGVKSAYYCDNHNVYLVTVDNSSMTPQLFLDTFKKYFAFVESEIKNGAVPEIVPYCSFEDPADYKSVKQKQ